jgi:hypothetical protein
MAGQLSPEVLARIQALEQERAERLAAEAIEAAAQAEMARRYPADVGDAANAVHDPDLFDDAQAPGVKQPFLPAPEKWDGEVSVEDSRNASLGLSGKIWMQTFTMYANEYQLEHIRIFAHYLKGKALLWFHQLVENANARQEDVSWDDVKAEFIRQYSPADRRTPAEITRSKLINHECTMPAFSSYTQYEQTFRNLIRSCPDMSDADKISWFISGLSPYFKRQCATQQDGRPWTDLDDLSRYAQGVEVRENASRTDRTLSSQKTNRKTFVAAASIPTQNLPAAKKARTEKSESPDSRTRLAKDEKGDRIPYRLTTLWKATVRNGWHAPDGKPYTPESFLAITRATPPRCLQCHKTWGKGGECKGHARPAAGGAAGGSGAGGALP